MLSLRLCSKTWKALILSQNRIGFVKTSLGPFETPKRPGSDIRVYVSIIDKLFGISKARIRHPWFYHLILGQFIIEIRIIICFRIYLFLHKVVILPSFFSNPLKRLIVFFLRWNFENRFFLSEIWKSGTRIYFSCIIHWALVGKKVLLRIWHLLCLFYILSRSHPLVRRLTAKWR